MYNKYGSKVRLTFKLELDQLWLGTKGNSENIEHGHYFECFKAEMAFSHYFVEIAFS